MEGGTGHELLDPEFMKKIGTLRLASRKIFTGKMKGERRSTRRGQSVEFADYRDYSPGDDLRFLDWNIYGRLERLFIKMFMEEEDLTFYIFLDASLSMGYGSPSKLEFAKRAAAALGYIALSKGDRVAVGTFSGNLGPVFPPKRGRKFLWPLLEFLNSIAAGGGTDSAASAYAFTVQNRRRGVVIAISDFLDKSGWDGMLKFFLARDLDIHVLHILSPEEIAPPQTGDLMLVDCEDGEEAEVTISAPLLSTYKKNLESFIGGFKDFCTKRGITYAFCSTASELDRLILATLKEKGLVK